VRKVGFGKRIHEGRKMRRVRMRGVARYTVYFDFSCWGERSSARRQNLFRVFGWGVLTVDDEKDNNLDFRMVQPIY
jgi:hypothetical protein